jgi:hypothetical protein
MSLPRTATRGLVVALCVRHARTERQASRSEGQPQRVIDGGLEQAQRAGAVRSGRPGRGPSLRTRCALLIGQLRASFALDHRPRCDVDFVRGRRQRSCENFGAIAPGIRRGSPDNVRANARRPRAAARGWLRRIGRAVGRPSASAAEPASPPRWYPVEREFRPARRRWRSCPSGAAIFSAWLAPFGPA